MTRIGSNESQELCRFQQRVDTIHKDVLKVIYPTGKGRETGQDPRALLTQTVGEAEMYTIY